MNRRKVLIGSAIGCGALLLVGLLVAVAAVVGVNIGMQKAKQQGSAGEGETTNVPKTKQGEEYIPVVLRVSGEQDTRYRCTHKNMADNGEVVFEEEEGTLRARPVEYKARILDTGISDPYSNFSAECVNQDPTNRGRIKAEVLVNEQVVASEETRSDPPGQKSSKSNRVSVTWGPHVPKDDKSPKGKK